MNFVYDNDDEIEHDIELLCKFYIDEQTTPQEKMQQAFNEFEKIQKANHARFG